MSAPLIIDAIALIYILISIKSGYSRGFIVGILGLVGFLVGLYLGLKYSPAVISYLPTLAVLAIAGRVRKLMIFKPVRWLDSLLGAIISGAIAISLVAVVSVVAEQTAPAKYVSMLKESEVISQIQTRMPNLLDTLMAEAAEKLR
ncbi:MAG: CvpA family protein [Actinobacteria bacterium]|nr:CvpA family protein [Actinomycetota bacterium]